MCSSNEVQSVIRRPEKESYREVKRWRKLYIYSLFIKGVKIFCGILWPRSGWIMLALHISKVQVITLRWQQKPTETFPFLCLWWWCYSAQVHTVTCTLYKRSPYGYMAIKKPFFKKITFLINEHVICMN